MIYRSREWLANRRATGHALARARAQGEADRKRAEEREWQRANPDPHEHAGFEPVSLEQPRLED